MSDLAIKLIEENKKNYSNGKIETFLDLGNCGLSTIPEELSELHWIQSINFGIQYYDHESTQIFNSSNVGANNLFRNAELSRLNKLPHLMNLSFAATYLTSFGFIARMRHLEYLVFTGNNLSHIERLGSIKLKYLDLSFNKIIDISNLRNLTNCSYLNLSGNKIFDAGPLASLKELTRLSLGNNRIVNLGFLNSLNKIEELDLRDNKVSNCRLIKGLPQLSKLELQYNQVQNLDFVQELPKLVFLNVGNNNLKQFSSILPLKDWLLNKSVTLHINDNPVLDELNIILNTGENHAFSIENIIERHEHKNKVTVVLPAKVLLLGNHDSGKSALLEYILTKRIGKSTNSTHIIDIKYYGSKDLPEAIFYDFGGQDYYHGIYRVFLSQGAIQLLVWKESSNSNTLHKQDKNGYAIRNYDLKYWVGQKKYIEHEQYEGQISPLLLIQTHADLNSRRFQGVHFEDVNLVNQHYLALTNTGADEFAIPKIKRAREYFHAEIVELISEGRKVVQEPKWYYNFIIKVMELSKSTSSHLPVSIDILQEYYDRPDSTLANFIEDLKQLHNQGLILYYRDELPKVVWLNPVALVDYIHNNILGKDVIRNQGILDITDLKLPHEILKLLELQKVIFPKDAKGSQYLIPNYLPLSCTDPDLSIHKFGLGTIILGLKFQEFIPFGLINQVISFFSRHSEIKKYWRDCIIFVFKGKLIHIQIDFDNLEINVHANEKLTVDEARYLFYCIISMYWNIEPLSLVDYEKPEFDFTNFKGSIDDKIKVDHQYYMKERLFAIEACFPQDLFVSHDGYSYIRYFQLYDLADTAVFDTYTKMKNEISTTITRKVPSYQFQLFTNKPLKKLKKLFISYSKNDLELVNEFQKHLAPLQRSNLIQSWYCTDLLAGEEWDSKIQSEFDSSDLVCFMVSANFLSTDYIYNYELKKAIERRGTDPQFRIVPIILNYCLWQGTEIGLAKYTALPYIGKPVCDFNQRDMAWYIVIECLKASIQSGEEAIGDGYFGNSKKLPKVVCDIFQRIVLGKVNLGA